MVSIHLLDHNWQQSACERLWGKLWGPSGNPSSLSLRDHFRGSFQFGEPVRHAVVTDPAHIPKSQAPATRLAPTVQSLGHPLPRCVAASRPNNRSSIGEVGRRGILRVGARSSRVRKSPSFDPRTQGLGIQAGLFGGDGTETPFERRFVLPSTPAWCRRFECASCSPNVSQRQWNPRPIPLEQS